MTRAISVTNWERIQARMGRNSAFPGMQVYCYGTFSAMDADWFKRFKSEATEEGLQVEVQRGIVYLVKEKV